MMATIEVAYELRETAEYLVAAEGAVWGRFAYDRYFKDVDADTTAQELAAGIVAGYAAALEGYPITMGTLAIRAGNLVPLVAATDDLAVALAANVATTRPYAAQAYADSQKFDCNWDLVFAAPDALVDLYDFAGALLAVVPEGETAVRAAAQGVLDAWAQVVVAETHRSGQPWLKPGVTWDYAGAHGLAIYLPVGEDHWLRDYYRGSELAWAADTQWDEFLHGAWYGGQAPPPLGALVEAGSAARIDPAQRPGLFAVRQNFFYLPFIGK